MFVGTFNPTREPGQDLVPIYDMDGDLITQWATRETEMISVYYFTEVESAPDGSVNCRTRTPGTARSAC